MKQWVSVGFVVTILAVSLPFFSVLAANSTLDLVYSANLDGELEPCGCSDQGDLGGIKRRVTLLDNIKKEYPDVVFISGGGLISSEGATDRIKADYIFKGFKALAYDAIGLQWRDLAFGEEFSRRDHLRWVSSNWYKPDIAESISITRNLGGRAVNLKVFSWLDPQQSPMRQMQGEHTKALDKSGKLNQMLKEADKQGAITVLTTSLPLESVKKNLSLQHTDILLVQSAYEVFSEPVKVGKTLVLQAGSRGMRVAQLQLRLSGSGDIASWRHKVIPMPEQIPDAVRMASWYDAYNAELKLDYERRAEVRKRRQSGRSPFIGEAACQICHSAQHKLWFDSEHALAFDKLEEVKKSYDPFCVKCHTVGYDQDGGFIDISITPHLMGVQCESCHGAARAHVDSNGAKPVSNKGWSREKICKQCHIQKHSPAFSVEKYWPRIAH